MKLSEIRQTHSVDIKVLRPPLLLFYTHMLSLDETGESSN